MVSKAVTAIIAILAIVAVGFYLFNSIKQSPVQTQTVTTEPAPDTTSEEQPETTTTLEDTGEPLSDLQITVCNAADKGKTCDTRLPKIGLVTKEECCRSLHKCC
jgi:flagellar basal body-associated protein FliL